MPVTRTFAGCLVEFTVDLESDLETDAPVRHNQKRRFSKKRKTWGWECECPLNDNREVGLTSLEYALGHAQSVHELGAIK